jgi:ribosomal-protein-alanine N-acetyltransferase
MPLPLFAELSTGRLLLRPLARTDLPDLLEVNGDDEVTRFLPYASWRGTDDASAWFDRVEALRAVGSAQQLVIERSADRKVIGGVLLFKFDEGSARLELGYVIGRLCWRQGYAREALRAVCDQCFAALGIRRIEAEVNPDNVASNQLLLSLGFVREGLLRKRWVAKGRAYDTVIYGCLAQER